MQKQKLGWMERSVIVCIDSYTDGVLAGRLYHSYSEGGSTFQSMSRFLTEMERTLNAMSFPQSFNTVRTFGTPKKPPVLPRSVEQAAEGALATFSIRVLFRQNASWQGSVRWIEGEQEESFRSALELIFLMDSVLSADHDQSRAG